MRVASGAGKTALGQVELDAARRPRLKIRIALSPADGAANKAIIAYAAKTIGAVKTPRFLGQRR